jgi:hypothetical protein
LISVVILCPSAPSTGWPDAYQLTPVVADSIPNDWAEVLRAELASPWYAQLLDKVKNDCAAGNVYPPIDQVFTAFRRTPLKDLRVVLLVQNPYHGAGQADGLAFSVVHSRFQHSQRGIPADEAIANRHRPSITTVRRRRRCRQSLSVLGHRVHREAWTAGR